MELENKNSLFNLFAQNQETFDEAQKKSNEEKNQRAKYLRFSQDGAYSVRILPLAPVIDAEGNALPLERKGYEYPLRSFTLKIVDDTKADGKPKMIYVPVCNVKQVFKDKIHEDIIEKYVERAKELYASDKALCDKLSGSSFDGGLKYETSRCMYVIDLDKPGDGIQVLQLSYAQYKNLEDAKLSTWSKLLKTNPKATCPISSFSNAYPVEIKRETENKKPSYKINLDILSGASPLTEETLQALLDAPRLPSVLYRYSRYHLEATIKFLEQTDIKYNIDVLKDEEVQNCIEQVKMLLPADDTSHFKLGKDGDKNEAGGVTIDDLWKIYDDLEEKGLEDSSTEGIELRTLIKEFSRDNNLGVKATRGKSNFDLLNELEDALKNKADEEPEEGEPQVTDNDSEPEPEEDEEESEDEPAAAPVPEDSDEDEEPVTRRRRRERNDDTNEPAARRSPASRPRRR